MPALPDTPVRDGCSPSSSERQQTVRENLDMRIQASRKRTEELCVMKAKADTLGILDYPQEFLERIVYL